MLLFGKPVAEAIEQNILKGVSELESKAVTPTISIVRIGNHEDDLTYEKMIIKHGKRTGIDVRRTVLNENSSQYEVECAIRNVNFDKEVHGVLLLRPLPSHIDEEKICSMLSYKKDIDGITPTSTDHVFSNRGPGFSPCTAEACIRLLEHYDIPLEGKNVAVIGRSLVIGKPVSLMLINKNATVTICHSKTQNIAEKCRNSDIIVAAAGKPEFVTSDFMSERQTIIDVGINVNSEGKLVGDVDIAAAQMKNCSITPVPGGVGAITSMLLLWHTVLAAYDSLK